MPKRKVKKKTNVWSRKTLLRKEKNMREVKKLLSWTGFIVNVTAEAEDRREEMEP